MHGYLSQAYADALSEWGTPVPLLRSGGWILERAIPGTDLVDARSLYPLLCCADWSALKEDLADLSNRWVSLVAVCDPLGRATAEDLKQTFNGPVDAFKEHYLADLRRDPADFVHASHRRRARRAAKFVTVDEVENPGAELDEWIRLYSVLVERHGVQGLRIFSRESFARQFEAPGFSMWRARFEGETLCMALWFLQQGGGYYHLGASSPEGYRLGASHAIFQTALRAFRSRGVQIVNLGGSAGLQPRQGDGLERFKRGWSSDSRCAYLCGSIFKQSVYDELTARGGAGRQNFFPAYRADAPAKGSEP